MIVILLAVMCANYVDINIIKQGDLSVRFVVGVFIFYQLVSILENWSSENNHKMAKVLQRILVNKAERHLNVPLADLFENKEEDGKLQNSN
jgi:phage-related holin